MSLRPPNDAVALPPWAKSYLHKGSAVAGFFIGIAAAEAQKRWAAAVQKRVGVTASMLSSMKAVRMTGLDGHLAAQIANLKQQELGQSNRFRRITTARNAISTWQALRFRDSTMLTIPTPGNFSLFMSPALTVRDVSLLQRLILAVDSCVFSLPSTSQFILPRLAVARSLRLPHSRLCQL